MRLVIVLTAALGAVAATASAQPGRSCRSDDECGSGTYCDGGACARVRRHVNLLYLFYLSGDRRFSEVLGVFWQRRGPSGYRVLFPVYWDFWDDPERERTRVVLPFLFERRNEREGTRNLIIPPFQRVVTPRERSTRVWPLVFYSEAGPSEYSLTIPPFFYRSRRDARRTTALPLFLSYVRQGPEPARSSGLVSGLFYWSRDADRRSFAVIPIFYTRSGPVARFAWLAPLNFLHHDASGTTLTALPLFLHRSRRFGMRSAMTISLVPPFFHRVSREILDLDLVPFLFFSRDRVRKHTFLLSGPVYYRKAAHGWSFSLFPVLFTGRGQDRSHTVLFPAFWHLRAGASRTVVAGPAYLHRDGDRALSTGLAPLFFYSQRRDASAPVARTDRSLVLLAPPYLHRRVGELEQDLAPPFFARWRDRRQGSTTWLVGGPIVRHVEPGSSATVVFPVFWRFKDRTSGASTSLLLPLALRRRDARGGHVNVLGPLFYRRRPGREGWSAGLAPVLFAGRHRGASHQVLFPLFWHLRAEAEPLRDVSGHDVLVVGPFFRARVARANTVVGLAPLFMAGRWDDRPFFTLAPPLFLRTSNPAAGTSFTLAGPYLRVRSGERTFQTLLPLFFRARARDRDGTRTSTTLVPFFHFRRSARDRLLVTLLGGHSRDLDTGRSVTVVGPLLHRRTRSSRTFALLPLLWHHTRRVTRFSWAVPPGGGLPPAHEERRATTVLAPLFVHDRSSAGERSTVLFPLLWSFRREGRRSLAVLPLFYRQRRQGLAVDAWLPAFVHVRHERGSATVLGPAFHVRRDATRSLGLLPLALLRRSPDATTFVSPVFFHRHDRAAGRRVTVLGPFYHHRDRAQRDLGLAPLIHVGHSALATRVVVFPVFWHVAHRERGTATTMIGPLYHRTSPRGRSLGIAPLLLARWDRDGGRRVCLLPLACYLRESGAADARRAFLTPVMGVATGAARTTVYAGPVLHQRSAGSALDAVLPLVVHHRDRRAAVGTLFALPGLYFGRWSANRRFHAVLPLFYRSSVEGTFGAERSTATVLFPLFWDFARGEQRRTTVLLPLFVRTQDRERETVSYLTPPALWVKPHRHGVDLALFPLLWHFAGPERRSLVAFPLLWHFRRGPSRATVVFPVVWRFDSPTRTTLVVLNTYYRRDKSDGTYDLNVLPVVRVQRKRPKDLRLDLLAGLFGFERIGRNRYLRLFFIPFELKPQPATSLTAASSRGWEL